MNGLLNEFPIYIHYRPVGKLEVDGVRKDAAELPGMRNGGD